MPFFARLFKNDGDSGRPDTLPEYLIKVLLIGNIFSGEKNEDSTANTVFRLANLGSPLRTTFVSTIGQDFAHAQLDENIVIQTWKSANVILENSHAPSSALLRGANIILICPDSQEDIKSYEQRFEQIASNQQEKRIMIAVPPILDILLTAIEYTALLHDQNRFLNIIPVSYDPRLFLQTLYDHYKGQFPPQKPDMDIVKQLANPNQSHESIKKIMGYLLELTHPEMPEERVRKLK